MQNSCVLIFSFRDWRLRSKARVEIQPVRVVALEQIDFPVALPFLELFFAAQHGSRRFVSLKPNQQLDLVSLGEAGTEAVLVLPTRRARSEVVPI
jgi:hypothetical protein